jgi:hypothetical protein
MRCEENAETHTVDSAVVGYDLKLADTERSERLDEHNRGAAQAKASDAQRRRISYVGNRFGSRGIELSLM